MDFSEAKRAETAKRHDEIASDLWPKVEAAEKKGKVSLACRLREFACDAEDVAAAARTSSAALTRVY